MISRTCFWKIYALNKWRLYFLTKKYSAYKYQNITVIIDAIDIDAVVLYKRPVIPFTWHIFCGTPAMMFMVFAIYDIFSENY